MEAKENKNNGFIHVHGGYRNLLSFQKAEIIFDGTAYFCNRFYEKRDRTFDQMIQAARSGKQNIAEASIATATSKETEIKLTNVARASLEELLLDYQDFLRIKKLKQWEKESKYVKRLQELNRTPNANYETFRIAIENPDPEVCANVMIGLITVAKYLLTRQLKNLENAFLNEGGLRERMTLARIKNKNWQVAQNSQRQKGLSGQ